MASVDDLRSEFAAVSWVPTLTPGWAVASHVFRTEGVWWATRGTLAASTPASDGPDMAVSMFPTPTVSDHPVLSPRSHRDLTGGLRAHHTASCTTPLSELPTADLDGFPMLDQELVNLVDAHVTPPFRVRWTNDMSPVVVASSELRVVLAPLLRPAHTVP